MPYLVYSQTPQKLIPSDLEFPPNQTNFLIPQNKFLDSDFKKNVNQNSSFPNTKQICFKKCIFNCNLPTIAEQQLGLIKYETDF